jgi:hypothetical protein
MSDAELIYAYLLSDYAHIFRYLHLKVEKILFSRGFFGLDQSLKRYTSLTSNQA